MRRTLHPVYSTSRSPRYIVRWDMHWRVLEVQQLAACADLRGAMTAAVKRLEADGWNIESDQAFGFTFATRGVDRCLLAMTERDPASCEQQSFNPFRGNHD